MSISVYSVFTAFLWFNLFILILSFLRRSLGVLLNYQLSPLIFAIVLSLVRLFVPFEPSFSVVVRSRYFLPSVLQALRTKYVVVGTVNIPLKIAIILTVVSLSALFMLIYMVSLHMKWKRMKRYAPTQNHRLNRIFERVKREYPSSRECKLLVLETVSCPCTYDYKFAAIVLPEWIYELTDRQISQVLRHEWQHFLHHDCTKKLFMEGLCYLLWWNPFIFLLKYDLNQTLELKRDKVVIAKMTEKQKDAYIESLVSIGWKTLEHSGKHPKRTRETLASIPFLGLSVLGQKVALSRLTQRANFIKDSPKKVKRKIGAVCITCLMLLFMGSFCFTVQPFGTPLENEIPSSSNSYDLIEITPETSYLVNNKDGTYSLFINGVFWNNILAEDITHEPHQSLPIIE